MKKHVTAFLTLICLSAEGWAENAATSSNPPLWGGVAVQKLDMADDFRSLNIAVPLPPLPYMPRLSYHRHAYETQERYSGAWQSGGAHSVQAQLPFGLTLEAGNRLDPFGRRDSEFVGLTFTYSRLRHHNDLIAAYKGSPQPGPIYDEKDTTSTGGKPQNSAFLWKLAGSVALVAVLAGGGGGGGASTTVTSNDGDIELPYFVAGQTGEWQEVWSDEFNGAVLDPDKWSTNDMYGRDENPYQQNVGGPCFGGGSNEEQCYTSRPENIFLQDGKLVLRAAFEPGYTATNNHDTETKNYTSGRIHSKGKGDFTYGRFEARIKLPSGKGSWPAFWMLPTPSEPNGSGGVYGTWAASGEIDIMEAVNLGGEDPSKNCFSPCQNIYGTLHYGGEWPNHQGWQQSGSAQLSDINAFHDYAIEWYPDEIRWFLNGQQYYSRSQASWGSNSAPDDPNAPFDRNFHMILNLAIGGAWSGATDGQNFPRQMEVDYVRVSQCGGDDPLACKQ